MEAEKNTEPAVSVSEAVSLAKAAVNSVPRLVVSGEVSGFRGPNARSGHCYFQIKDEMSALDTIVWRGVYAKAGFELRDGLEVLVTGGFDVYERSGRLSFIATKIEVSGEGILRQQVAQLARRLAAEGLMDDARKRKIPAFCTRVAVVTSLSGSVIEDVKRTLARRNPLVEIDVFGCKVQGEGAEPTIIRALDAASATQPDCILLVRGGGSFEDLMTFNDERLARAIAACPVPVVAGIGHEPDHSIADMVADRSCSTPTAAAESVAPAISEILRSTDDRQVRLVRATASYLERAEARSAEFASVLRRAFEARLRTEHTHIEVLAAHRCLSDPQALLEPRMTTLMRMSDDLGDAMPRYLATHERNVRELGARLRRVGTRIVPERRLALEADARSLEALSPLRVLERGYTITRDAAGHVISDVRQAPPGTQISVRLAKGTLDAEVLAATDQSFADREA